MKNGLIALMLFASTWAFGQKETEKIEIQTSSVCNMCKLRIEKDFTYEKGVESAKLDVKTGILTVVYKPEKTSPAKIKERVTKIGYNADDLMADPKAYEKLPDCCQYTKTEKH